VVKLQQKNFGNSWVAPRMLGRKLYELILIQKYEKHLATVKILNI